MEGIKVPVSLEVVQSSITAVKNAIANLKPNSKNWETLQGILRTMEREADRLAVTMSKPFTSETQFTQAEKSIDKIDEALSKASLTMSRLKFSDIQLTPEQQATFDVLNQQLADIQNQIKSFKANAKAELQKDNVWQDIIKIDPNAATRTFDELLKVVRKKNTELQNELQKAQEAANDFQKQDKAASFTEKVFKEADPLSEAGIGKENFEKFFQPSQTPGEFEFKSGQAAPFYEWVKENFTLTNEQLGQIKEKQGQQVIELFRGFKEDALKKANETHETNAQKSTEVAEIAMKAASGVAAVNAMGQKVDELANLQGSLSIKTAIATTQIEDFKNSTARAARGSQDFRSAEHQMQSALDQLRGTLNATNDDFLRMQRVQQSFSQMKSAVVNFMGFSQVLNLTRNAVRGAIDHIRELDTVMNGISIVTDMSTGDLWNQVDAYSKMAQSYGVSIKGAYEVSQIYYQQGLETADVMTLTNETLKLAKISGLDYATTTDYMTTALRGFKIEMSDAARVVDVYSALAANTAVSQEELAVAMSKTASSMEGVGATFEEASAMIGTMVAVTRESATNIGSAMKSIASRYGELTKDPTKLVDEDGEAMAFNRVDAALQSVGISMKTVDGQFRNFTDVIIELGEKWNELDSTQQRYIATQFAGNRQQSRFLALVSNVDMLKSNLDVAMNSEDTGTLQALKALDSIEAKTEQVRVAYQQFYTTVHAEDVWKGLLDSTRSVIDTLNGLPKLFNTIPIGAIAGIANIVTLIRTVLSTAISGIARIWTSALNNTAQTASSSGEKIGSTLMSSIKSQIEAGTPAVQAAIKAALSIDQQQATNIVNPLNTAQQALYQSTKQNRQNIPVLLGSNGKPITQNPDYWENKAKQYADNGMMSQEAYQNAAATGQFQQAVEQANASIEKYNGLLRESTQAEKQNVDATKVNTETKKASLVEQFKNGIADKYSKWTVGLNAVATAFTTLGLALDKTTEAGRISSGVFTAVGGTIQTIGAGARLINGDVTALLPLLTGVMNIFNGIGIAIESPAEKLERLTKEAEQLSNEAKKARAEYRTLDSTIKKVNELKEKRYESAEAAEEYQSAINDLADTFPALIGGFDEAGNAILDAAAQERLLANARKESAKATYEAAMKEYDAAKEQIKQKFEDTSNTSLGVASLGSEAIKQEFTTASDASVVEMNEDFKQMIADSLDSLTSNNIRAKEGLQSSIESTVPLLGETLDNYIKRVIETYNNFLDQNFIGDLPLKDKIKALQSNFNLKESQSLQHQYNVYQDGMKNANLAEIDQFAAIATAFDLSNKMSSEGQAYFKQMVDAYDAIYKKYDNDKEAMTAKGINVEKLDNFQSVIEEWVKAYAELDKLNEAFKINGTAVAAAYQSLQGVGKNYIENSSSLMSVVSSAIEQAVPQESTWTDFINSDAGKKAVEESISTADQLYNSLMGRYTESGEELTQVLDKMLSDSGSYNAEDIIKYFGEYSPLSDEFELMLFNYYNQLSADLYTNLDNYLGQQKNTQGISRIKTEVAGLKLADHQLVTDESAFLTDLIKQVAKFDAAGYTDTGAEIAKKGLALFEAIEAVEDNFIQNNISDLVRKNGITTNEGIQKTRAAVEAMTFEDEEQKNKILDGLDNLNKSIHSNINLSIQSATSEFLTAQKSTSENLNKALKSGLSLQEVDELITQAQNLGITISTSDFQTSGDKLILTAQAFNNYWQQLIKTNNISTTRWDEAIQKAEGLLNNTLDPTNIDLQQYIQSSFGVDIKSEGWDTKLKAAVDQVKINKERFEWYNTNAAKQLAQAWNWEQGNYFNPNQLNDAGKPVYESVFKNINDLLTKGIDFDTNFHYGKNTEQRTLLDSLYKSYNTLISDVLSKGIENIHLDDYTGIINDEGHRAELQAALKNGYESFITQYAKFAGASVDETNDWLAQAIKKDKERVNPENLKKLQFISSDKFAASLEDLNELAKQYDINLSDLTKNWNQELGKYIVNLQQLPSEIINVENYSSIIQDSISTFFSDLNKLINNALKGALSAADRGSLQAQIEALGITGLKLNFTTTAEGLKLSEKSAIALYAKIREINSLAAQTTFKNLMDSMAESNELYGSVASITGRIKDLQDAINKADSNISNDRLDEYKAELSVAKEILAVRSATQEDKSFDFMSNNIPGSQNNPLNFYSGMQKMMKTIADGVKVTGRKGKKQWVEGFIDYKDFYNIATELGDLAKLGGPIEVAGITLDGSMEKTAALIQKGAESLTTIDTGDLKVSLQAVGLDILGGANSLSSGVDKGMKEFAKSQIKMLDGAIAMLEAIVTMQSIGDSAADLNFDFNEDNVFDPSELFSAEGIEKANYFLSWVQKFSSVKIDGKSLGAKLTELANSGQEGANKVFNFFSTFSQWLSDPDYDFTNFAADLQTLLNATFSDAQKIDIGKGVFSNLNISTSSMTQGLVERINKAYEEGIEGKEKNKLIADIKKQNEKLGTSLENLFKSMPNTNFKTALNILSLIEESGKIQETKGQFEVYYGEKKLGAYKSKEEAQAALLKAVEEEYNQQENIKFNPEVSTISISGSTEVVYLNKISDNNYSAEYHGVTCSGSQEEVTSKIKEWMRTFAEGQGSFTYKVQGGKGTVKVENGVEYHYIVMDNGKRYYESNGQQYSEKAFEEFLKEKGKSENIAVNIVEDKITVKTETGVLYEKQVSEDGNVIYLIDGKEYSQATLEKYLEEKKLSKENGNIVSLAENDKGEELITVTTDTKIQYRMKVDANGEITYEAPDGTNYNNKEAFIGYLEASKILNGYDEITYNDKAGETVVKVKGKDIHIKYDTNTKTYQVEDAAAAENLSDAIANYNKDAESSALLTENSSKTINIESGTITITPDKIVLANISDNGEISLSEPLNKVTATASALEVNVDSIVPNVQGELSPIPYETLNAAITTIKAVFKGKPDSSEIKLEPITYEKLNAALQTIEAIFDGTPESGQINLDDINYSKAVGVLLASLLLNSDGSTDIQQGEINIDNNALKISDVVNALLSGDLVLNGTNVNGVAGTITLANGNTITIPDTQSVTGILSKLLLDFTGTPDNQKILDFIKGYTIPAGDGVGELSNLTVGLKDGSEPTYNKIVTLKFDSATATTDQLVISTVTGEKKVTDLSNISAGDSVNATASTATISADTYHLEWQKVNADGEIVTTKSIDIPAKLLFENNTNSIQAFLEAEGVPQTQIELLTDSLDKTWKLWKESNNKFIVTPQIEEEKSQTGVPNSVNIGSKIKYKNKESLKQELGWDFGDAFASSFNTNQRSNLDSATGKEVQNYIQQLQKLASEGQALSKVDLSNLEALSQVGEYFNFKDENGQIQKLESVISQLIDLNTTAQEADEAPEWITSLTELTSISGGNIEALAAALERIVTATQILEQTSWATISQGLSSLNANNSSGENVEIETGTTEINVITTTDTSGMMTEIENAKTEATKEPATQKIEGDADEVVNAGKEATDTVNRMRASINIVANSSATSVIDNIKTALKNLVDGGPYKVTVQASVSGSTGSTGNLGGGPGLSNTTTLSRAKGTLMGELGPELVVSKGHYFVAGQNGPEMVNLADDAIVFNHLQTESLLTKGMSNGRGRAVTNERNAISFATGNVDGGPAMASASAALATLKQLRAMWESLLGASVSDLAGAGGGGGGGGGGKNKVVDPKAWVKTVERWYNLTQEIAKLEKDITHEETLRSKLQSDFNKNGTHYYNSQRLSLKALREQVAAQEQLNLSRQDYYTKRIDALRNEPLGKLYTFDEQGQMHFRNDVNMNGQQGAMNFLTDLMGFDENGKANYTNEQKYNILKQYGFDEYMKYNSNGEQILLDADHSGDVTDEERETYYQQATEAWRDRMDNFAQETQSLWDSIQEGENNLLELQTNENELLQEMRDNQIEVEEDVLKAIEDMRQREIDALQDERDKLEDSTEKYIEGLSDALSKEQEMYNNQKEENDLNQQRRRLAILQRSGGSAADITNLQNEINSNERSRYFDLQQQQIDAIQQASDLQLERMDSQIELMTETLEYQKEYGLLWGEVYDVMSHSAAQITSFIMNGNSEFWAKSPLGSANSTNETLFKAEQWVGFREDMTDVTTDVAALAFATREQMKANDYKIYNDAMAKEFGSNYDSTGKYKGIFEQVYNETGDLTKASAAARAEYQKDKQAEEAKKLTTITTAAPTPAPSSADSSSGSSNNNKCKGCAGECTKGCAYSCTGKCDKGCKENCGTDCERGCATGCKETCKTKCTTGCYSSCLGGCKGSSSFSAQTYTASLPKKASGGFVNHGIYELGEKGTEGIFNARQTRILRENILSNKPNSLITLLNTYNEAYKDGISVAPQEASGQLIIENATVNMNVQQIANDYDARRAGEQALNEMMRIARKTGAANSIRR